MRCTAGILAHVDAGKTTLSEQLLYLGGALRERGRVDHGDAFLDAEPIERRRGITVFSGQADFQWGETTYYLLDTPVHTERPDNISPRCKAADKLARSGISF